MKTLKKNNKGFSLVELIVVILIMAIIAVALAPQVMKWVGESKKSADENNTATIKSVMDAAVADYMSGAATATVPETIVFVNKDLYEQNASTKITNPSSGSLEDYIVKTMNCKEGKYPYVQAETGKCFKVTITSTGSVAVEIANFAAIPTGTP